VHLVPQDTILQDLPQRTFADLQQALAHSKDRVYHTDSVKEDFASIGCGPGNSSPFSRVERRHRLEAGEDPSACNNITNFFCWMRCMPVPDPPVDNAVATASSLYCLDPRTLDTTQGNVTAAVTPCNGASGQPGGKHNDICVGQWQPSVNGLAEAVQVKENLVTGSSDDSFSAKFCYGGTSMYMDGFHWLGNTCVIYLFPDWVVSTSGALVGACIGTIFVAMALEGIIRLRRFAVAQMPMRTWKRLICSTTFYGLQLTMGYLIMLIVMTYSGPLFLSAILGLMVGHIVFNADQAACATTDVVRSAAAALKEGSAASSYGSTEQRTVDKPCNGSLASTDDTTPTGSDLVPEGITPCCQNTI
jgi:Ctr copper transporter family